MKGDARNAVAVEGVPVVVEVALRERAGAGERAWHRIEAGDVPRYDEVKR